MNPYKYQTVHLKVAIVPQSGRELHQGCLEFRVFTKTDEFAEMYGLPLR